MEGSLLWTYVGILVVVVAVMVIWRRELFEKVYVPYVFAPLRDLAREIAYLYFKYVRGEVFLYVHLPDENFPNGSVERTTRKEKPDQTIRFVCISDTHEAHFGLLPTIPDGDVFVHAGDILFQDRGDGLEKLKRFNTDFLGKLPHKHKIVIGGNHDTTLEQLGASLSQEILSNAIYLEDSLADLEFSSNNSLQHLRIFGSPISGKGWSKNRAFQLPLDSNELKEHWRKLPDQVDIIITHGHPRTATRLRGCNYLAETINKIKPRVHIFGHDHGNYGVTFENAGEQIITRINAAMLDIFHLPSHLPIVFDISVQ